MKISASIYSNKQDNLEKIIEDLENNHMDMFHIDCKDDLSVFQDIDFIQSKSRIPLDVHIITSTPAPFFEEIRKRKIDNLCFQHEDLPLKGLPGNLNVGRLGIAITTETPIDIFEHYKNVCDYILIMATVPGESGGKFDKRNFKKIRDFQNRYPGKKIFVDGGVNGEVSFILRNMGVYSSVSGSYLFNSSSIGSALLSLKTREVESHFLVKDFMLKLEECPVILDKHINLKNVLQSIEKGKMGFAMVVSDSGKMEGIVSNADIRKALLDNIEHMDLLDVRNYINRNPKAIDEEFTVKEMISYVKQQKIPLMYLPIKDSKGNAKGIITFMNLIKGEL
ncbi:MAG: CBS domain-containing protein [Crocinitomicaceae bacterium]